MNKIVLISLIQTTPSTKSFTRVTTKVIHRRPQNHPMTWFAKDIVEIFTFENRKVVRVDVIQPKDLFGR